MKSKERVAKQGVARGEEVGERIKSVWRGGRGKREGKKCIFHSHLVIKNI